MQVVLSTVVLCVFKDILQVLCIKLFCQNQAIGSSELQRQLRQQSTTYPVWESLINYPQEIFTTLRHPFVSRCFDSLILYDWDNLPQIWLGKDTRQWLLPFLMTACEIDWGRKKTDSVNLLHCRLERLVNVLRRKINGLGTKTEVVLD